MNRPYGVLFDLGDTVLHREATDWAAGNKRMLEFARDTSHISVDDIQRAADEIWAEVSRLRDELGIELRWQVLERLLIDNLGVSFHTDYAELEKEFWRSVFRYKPTEGIYAVMDTLEKYRIKTGIVSNTTFTGATLEEELARHNLAHRFSCVVSSADYGFSKPHRRIFQVAVRKMNLSPQDIWFVGDKLEYDVKGAAGCGLNPVWYNWCNEPGNSAYPYLEVKNWYEFMENIESLCSQRDMV